MATIKDYIESYVKVLKKKRVQKHVHVSVVDWVARPLKQIVETALLNQVLPTNLYTQEFFKDANKREQRDIKYRIVRVFIALADVRVTTEHSHSGKERACANWDLYFREERYAHYLGVEIPFTLKSKELNNARYLFFKDVDEVVFPVIIRKGMNVRDKLHQQGQWILEPCYALEKRAGERDAAYPIIHILERHKSGKKTTKEIMHSYAPDEADERPTIVVYDDELKCKVITKGKIHKETPWISPYAEDQELIGTPQGFYDWATRLVEIDNKYDGDVVQAVKDLKHYYYNTPRVHNILQAKYQELSKKKSNAVSFDKFIETLMSYDDTPLDEYPLHEVLDEVVELS